MSQAPHNIAATEGLRHAKKFIVAGYIFGLSGSPLLVYQYIGDGYQREPVRILIADDHEVIRRSVIRVIESRDEFDECVEATNGREAVEKALEWKPDLVLLDIRLPILSGFEVSRLIKQHDPTIPILFFSIYDTDDILEEARLVGDGFILKEKIVEMLPNALKALLRKQTFFPSKNAMEPNT